MWKISGFIEIIDSGLVKLGYKYNNTLCLIETVSFLESKVSYLKKCIGKKKSSYMKQYIFYIVTRFFLCQNAPLCCVQS